MPSARHSGVGFLGGGDECSSVVCNSHHQCSAYSDDIFIFESLTNISQFLKCSI